jgi:3-hydroxybutyrate dehydrogenase
MPVNASRNIIALSRNDPDNFTVFSRTCIKPHQDLIYQSSLLLGFFYNLFNSLGISIFQMIFKDKVVCITGASRGIGRAIALAFADQGASLIIISRDNHSLDLVKEQIESKGRLCQAIACDVRASEELRVKLAKVVSSLGAIDVLINNAGIYKTESVQGHSKATWDDTIAINLTAAFFLCQNVIASMISRNWGRIVNISSVSGKAAEAYGAAYSATKFGIIGLTQALALEVAQSGVTVNAICPGWVLTDMASQQLEDPKWCALNDIEQSQSVEIARLSIPQQRFVKSEEVADLAVFLCSNQAKSITGQAINICGGLSLR